MVTQSLSHVEIMLHSVHIESFGDTIMIDIAITYNNDVPTLQANNVVM
jgi:hypothetical protein